MFLNRLKIALRLMLRQRFFTILNLLGLASGAACFLLIYVYVADELSYDQFHENKEQLYRINMTNIWIENNDVFGSTGPGVSKAIKNDIPEAKHVVKVHTPYLGAKLIQVEDAVGNIRSFEESWIIAADNGFFDVFTFPFLNGDPQTALDNPNSAVISREYAGKYFPNQEALGKTLTVGTGDQKQSMMVTGVVEDIPDNSHFDFDILFSINSFPHVKRREDAWIWTAFVTYAVFEEDSDMEAIANKLQTLPIKYVGEEEAAQKNWELYLQKVTDIHLYSDEIPNRLGSVGSIDNVIIFSTVAILILLLSCVNFMNLSTARYADRAKEVGIHKVLGSGNSQVRIQFLTESLMYSLFAVVLGFGLAELLKSWFNMISGKTLSINIFDNPSIGLLMMALVFVIGTLSGSYPAWFLTRFKPVDVLKGKSRKIKSKSLRNSLVVFQFTISIALLGSSFLVKDQLNFLENKSLGFDEENLLIIPHMEWMTDRGKTYRDILESNSRVVSASVSNQMPPDVWYQESLTPMGSEKSEDLAVSTMITDDQFIETLGLQLVAGRNFFSEGEGDIRSIVINEKCAIQMGFLKPGEDPNNVLGKKIAMYDPENQFNVVGVLKDFNFWDLNIPVEPLAIFHPNAPMWKGDQHFLLARLNSKNLDEYQEIIAHFQTEWQKINPALPFEYYFMDEEFDAAFESQRRFGQVLDTFTILAVLIAILGLIGLISFTAEQRTKEFSIRKVLGASIPHLIGIVTYDFLKLLLLGFLIGSGLCFYYGREWLNNFAYRTQISPFIFIVSGAILLLLITGISLIIIQKNARKNPAMTLRDE